MNAEAKLDSARELDLSRSKAIKRRLKQFLPGRLTQSLTESRLLTACRSQWKRWRLRNRGHDDVYGADYFEMIDATTGRSAKIMARSIVERLAPARVVDLGCGTGNLILELSALGVETKGAEYAQAALAYCRERGLDVVPLDLNNRESLAETLGRYDLAISTEVAIQLPPAAAEDLIDYLCRHADTVLFSSPPCARDRLPKSPQTAEFWKSRFASRGFRFDPEVSAEFQTTWEREGTVPWLHRDPMVFRRGIDEAAS